MPSEFNWKPSRATAGEETPRTLSLAYGGGYEQRAGDGPNAIAERYNVEFRNISIEVCAAIKAFIRSKKGYISFTWTPPRPDNVEAKFICRERWRTGYNGNLRDLALIFDRRFEP